MTTMIEILKMTFFCIYIFCHDIMYSRIMAIRCQHVSTYILMRFKHIVWMPKNMVLINTLQIFDTKQKEKHLLTIQYMIHEQYVQTQLKAKIKTNQNQNTKATLHNVHDAITFTLVIHIRLYYQQTIIYYYLVHLYTFQYELSNSI